MTATRMLLVVGSPRKSGTSYSFSRTLKSLAEKSGHQADIVFAIDYLDGRRGVEDLRDEIARADIIALVSSVYVDTLPYPLVWLLENIAQHLTSEPEAKAVFAVAQCAFPDVELCEPSLESCRCFARSTGMRWLGGLGHAGGVLINGAHLETLGRKGQKITRAFELAVKDVFAGKVISPESQRLLTTRIPRLLYYPLSVVMNFMNKRAARRLATDLARKVYHE